MARALVTIALPMSARAVRYMPALIVTKQAGRPCTKVGNSMS